MTGPASGPANQVEVRRAISRGVVAILKETVGRGPTNARTFIAEELVLVLLEDTLTVAERTLAEEDRVELVREMRRTYLGTMRDRMKELVARETGREVRAVLGDHSVLPDFSFSAFLLEPDPGTRPAVDTPGAGAGSEEALSEGQTIAIAPRNAPNGEVRAQQREISHRIVALFKDLVGRGPKDARTYIEDGAVFVLLGDTLTAAEHTIVEEDDENSADVRRIRRIFQELMEDQARTLIEEITQRPVKAFLSDHSVFPDYAIELFVLGKPS